MKMNKSICCMALFCAAIMAVTSACEKEHTTKNERTDIILTKAQNEIAAIGNEFTFDFLRELNAIENSSAKNIFTSPMSAQMLYSIAANGASGETKSQILNALQFASYSIDEINEYYKTIVPALIAVDKTVKLSFANSAWAANGFIMKTDYIDKLKQYYNAEGRNINDDKNKAVQEVNKWCSDKTNGMIDKIIDIDEITPLRLMLINAIYFKGIWSSPFKSSDNYSDKFYNADGTTANVEFMYKELNHKVWYDSKASAIRLSYGNSAYSMTIVLPADDQNIDEFIKNITLEDWNNWKTGNSFYKVKFSLPKFETEYATQNKLIRALENMGMVLPFTPAADFSGISAENTYIGCSNQKAVIKVDEKGTEAAVVTYTGGVTSAGPGTNKEFIFKTDHPFIYFINEISTGAIIFAGVQKKF